MKNLIYLFFCLAIAACNSNSQGNNQRDSTKSNTKKVAYSRPLDLARLKLNENLPELMAAQGIKREPKDSTDETMLDYEVFKSSDPKALRFANTDLSGVRGKNRNHVLFHFNESQKTLACYELTLYDQAQTDSLINLLGKAATLVFKQTHLPKGTVALDLNGNAIKPDKVPRKTYRVWENKANGLTYFLSEDGIDPTLTTELIVLRRSTPFGKDWISSGVLDWYKRDQSEPLNEAK
jgi:hypothetical protein